MSSTELMEVLLEVAQENRVSLSLQSQLSSADSGQYDQLHFNAKAGGVLTFGLEGGKEKAFKFIDSLSLAIFIPYHGTTLRRMCIEHKLLDPKEEISGDGTVPMIYNPNLSNE